MYLIDITRIKNGITNDALLGKYSSEAKAKAMDYIMDYILANHNLSINKELLDRYFDNAFFSLKTFMKDMYSYNIEDDLIIQVAEIGKKNYLVGKGVVMKHPFLLVYPNNHVEDIKQIMAFTINEWLLGYYETDATLDRYYANKVDANDLEQLSYSSPLVNAEIYSLPQDGPFLEELLNNSWSMKQVASHLDLKI